MTAPAASGPAFPQQVAGWRAAAPVEHYDGEGIFDYIDGHGEVYLAYGMRVCHARRYEGPQGEGGLVADVFEMASAADAYGVFTHSREGEPVDVGRASSLGHGVLGFWQGTFFVSITAELDTPSARAALVALGRALADSLPKQGDPPALLERLPGPGLVADTVVYLRHPQILNAHAAIGPGNPLRLGARAPALLAAYRRGSDTGRLLIVDYASRADAEVAQREFAARFLEAAQPTRRGDGWYAASPRAAEGLQAFVLRATSRALAEALLAEAGERSRP